MCVSVCAIAALCKQWRMLGCKVSHWDFQSVHHHILGILWSPSATVAEHWDRHQCPSDKKVQCIGTRKWHISSDTEDWWSWDRTVHENGRKPSLCVLFTVFSILHIILIYELTLVIGLSLLAKNLAMLNNKTKTSSYLFLSVNMEKRGTHLNVATHTIQDSWSSIYILNGLGE